MMVEVIQADRDRIADRYRELAQPGIAEEIASGKVDDHPNVQMVAAHRIASLSGVAELVDTLRQLRADLAEEDAEIHAQRIAVIDAALSRFRANPANGDSQ